MVHPLPRGAQIAQGLVARSARTGRAPARLRQRRLADALGAAPWHDSAAAVPQPAHSRFCSGLAPALPVILAALAVPVGELRNDGEASLECKNGGSYDDQPTCAQASQK